MHLLVFKQHVMLFRCGMSKKAKLYSCHRVSTTILAAVVRYRSSAAPETLIYLCLRKWYILMELVDHMSDLL